MEPTTIMPKTGDDRKILCCTFGPHVHEYGEVLEGLALGHDPHDGSWFLSRDHHKDIVFPIRPYKDSWDEFDVAEAAGADVATLAEIEKRLEAEIPEDVFVRGLKDIDIVRDKTIADHQNLLYIYEMARKVGYELERDGTFVLWLFHRAGRLVETGKV
jgi:hypothetical protein